MVVFPISNGGELTQSEYSLMTFSSSYTPSPAINPLDKDRAISLSSVTYPGATFNCPPPGICIACSISFVDTLFPRNSKKDPIVSPRKAAYTLP